MDKDRDPQRADKKDSDSSTVVPFSRQPTANMQITEAGDQYGLQPGTAPLVAELVATIHATLEHCQPHARAAATKAALRGYLCDDKLLTTAQ